MLSSNNLYEYKDHLIIATISINKLRINDKHYSSFTAIFYYSCAGDVSIPGGMTFTEDSDLNGDNPQFTLTCISTGGPATTVTWTRDSQTLSGGVTVLDDPETAQYTHTLTVTGRLDGVYQCSITNNKPSEATATYAVQGTAGIWCDMENISLSSSSSSFSFFLFLLLLLLLLLLLPGYPLHEMVQQATYKLTYTYIAH